MQQELVINILGPSTLSALNIITSVIGDHNCNILDSRHAQYGTDFSLTMIVSGAQSDITLLEIDLSGLCVLHDLLCVMKRTSGHKKQNIGQYIGLEFEGQDATGMMQKITQNLSLFGVSVHALRQKTSTLDNQAMLSCKMILSAPKSIDLPSFDERLRSLLYGLGLHGKISHNTAKENDEYIESW